MIMLYKVVLTFMFVDETLKREQLDKRYGGVQFLVVLFIMLYRVVLSFESVDEIPKCDHSNKSY